MDQNVIADFKKLYAKFSSKRSLELSAISKPKTAIFQGNDLEQLRGFRFCWCYMGFILFFLFIIIRKI